MNYLKTILDWLQGLISDDNGIADDARICAILMVATFIGLAVFDVVILKNKFSPLEYGTGASALAGGIGAWFKWRGDK